MDRLLWPMLFFGVLFFFHWPARTAEFSMSVDYRPIHTPLSNSFERMISLQPVTFYTYFDNLDFPQTNTSPSTAEWLRPIPSGLPPNYYLISAMQFDQQTGFLFHDLANFSIKKDHVTAKRPFADLSLSPTSFNFELQTAYRSDSQPMNGQFSWPVLVDVVFIKGDMTVFSAEGRAYVRQRGNFTLESQMRSPDGQVLDIKLKSALRFKTGLLPIAHQTALSFIYDNHETGPLPTTLYLIFTGNEASDIVGQFHSLRNNRLASQPGLVGQFTSLDPQASDN